MQESRNCLYWSVRSYLRDTLSSLSPAQDSPGDTTWVLPLQEERLGLAILEAEDLAIGADEELALIGMSATSPCHSLSNFAIALVSSLCTCFHGTKEHTVAGSGCRDLPVQYLEMSRPSLH